jgi:thioester reductase-like protein
MAQARQIGKIVISLDRAPIAAEPTAVGPGTDLRANATYLITGGLSGFGAVVAESMALKGARNLVLMGRKGAASPEARQAIAVMRKNGANVVVVRGDVSQEKDVRRVVAYIARKMPPLRGVIHAAGIYDDGTLLHLNAERFSRVLAPKVRGGWLLHRATLNLPLDFFVLFSSAAAVVGNPGQGNYVAANVFLDALAHQRHALGLPALAINWGLLTEVGYSARTKRVQEHFTRLGWTGMSPRQAVHMLARVMQTLSPQLTVARINWSRVPEWMANAPRYSLLMGEALRSQVERTDDATWVREALLHAAPGEKRKVIEDHLGREIAKALRTQVSKLDVDKPLTELGLDSLMVVELVTRVDRQLGAAVPAGKLMGSSTIARLAEVLLEVLTGTSAPAPIQDVPASTREVVVWENEITLDPGIAFNPSPVDHSRSVNPQAVFLTGSTDFLSTFLMRDLCRTTRAEIYCLCTALDVALARSQIQTEFNRYKIAVDMRRIVPVLGDLAQPLFGQSRSQFTELAGKVDAIFHNGALVNHLATYARLRAANVVATNSAIRMAAAGRGKPVHYVSSLSVLAAQTGPGTLPASENDPLANTGRLAGGYPQSRWVAEKILELARARGVTANVYRPGLLIGETDSDLAPPDNLVWWILELCLQMGCGPKIETNTFLTPVDYVSASIVSLARVLALANGTFHLINSKGSTIREILQAAQSFGYELDLVTSTQWEARLDAMVDPPADNPLFPYLVLVPRKVRAMFYDFRTWPQIDCRATDKHTSNLGLSCPPVNEAQLHRHFDCFVRNGFIPGPLRQGAERSEPAVCVPAQTVHLE